MNLEEARRLRDNADYNEFLKVLDDDTERLKEDMLTVLKGALPEELAYTNLETVTKIQTIRLVKNRLLSIIEDLEVEEESVRSRD